jgi:hypothetical protein
VDDPVHLITKLEKEKEEEEEEEKKVGQNKRWACSQIWLNPLSVTITRSPT